MNELLKPINEIIEYGLAPNIVRPHRDVLLEKALIEIYRLSFYISYEFDDSHYPDFIKSQLPIIRKNVEFRKLWLLQGYNRHKRHTQSF